MTGVGINPLGGSAICEFGCGDVNAGKRRQGKADG
jgi:hypothetical protein